ncbi:unnamed protein product [Amoebophrya sp. A120]|nr:unnamed protein product [Amoebophrya sp. A120]|eukprot:GSA120T00001199001.1
MSTTRRGASPPRSWPQHLNHKERKMVMQQSSIFDDGGPSNASIYDPRRQREVLWNVNKQAQAEFVPNLEMPTAQQIKIAHSGGHGLICGDGISERDAKRKSELQLLPGGHAASSSKEGRDFWEASRAFGAAASKGDRMTFNGATTVPPKNTNIEAARVLRQRQHNSTVFGADFDPSTKARSAEGFDHGWHEGINLEDSLIPANANFLAHPVKANRDAEKSAAERFHGNLHSREVEGEMHERKKFEPPEDPRRHKEKNFSDIFGPVDPNLHRKKVVQREEALGTYPADHYHIKSEISARNLTGHRSDDFKTARERKMHNMFGNEHHVFGSGMTANLAEVPERRSSAINEFVACSAIRDGMSQAAEVLREQRAMPASSRPQTHHGRKVQELSGNGYVSQLSEKDYVQSSKARQLGILKNQDDGSWVTHAGQKAWRGAQGEIIVGPSEKMLNGAVDDMPRELPGYGPADTRKQLELRGNF